MFYDLEKINCSSNFLQAFFVPHYEIFSDEVFLTVNKVRRKGSQPKQL